MNRGFMPKNQQNHQNQDYGGRLFYRRRSLCFYPEKIRGEHLDKDKLLDLFYPPRCPVCGRILKTPSRYIHETCRRELPWIHEPRCKRCGAPLEDPTRELCRDCRKRTFSFQSGRSLWVYEKKAKQITLDYKYKNKKEYTRFFVDEMARGYGEWIAKNRIRYIVPVPLNKKKRRDRGYNQAELLAVGLGKRLGVPVYEAGLVRLRYTSPQKQLGPIERRRNLEKSIRAGKLPDKAGPVLLIDDIYTTGATMEACAKALKQAGAKKIFFLTLCGSHGS